MTKRMAAFGLDNCRVERRAIKDGRPVTVTLPFPVSVNSMFGQAPGKQRYPSQAYKAWQESAEWMIASSKPPRVPGQVHLLFELAETDKRQRDLTNYLKGPEDMLVKHGIIDGDHSSVVRHVEARWNAGISGIRITITPYAFRSCP